MIVAALLGLNLILSGSTVTLEARLSLLVVLLLAALVPPALPRTLISDGVEIRWKRPFQPPQTMVRSELTAILYQPSAASGKPRFYFVGRDGQAVLWIDRFTPQQMGSFAAYLGLTVQTVSKPPMENAAAVQIVSANAITGSRRAMIAVMAACLVAGTVLTAVMTGFIVSYRGVLADYQRAPLCEGPAANPRACRFDTQAQVTGFTGRGAAELRFPHPVATLNSQTTSVGLLSAPDPAFSVGDTVQVEVFDGWLMAINGARTTAYGTLEQNSSLWLVGAAVGLFMIAPGIAIVLAWRGPASWFVPRAAATHG